jgi:ABC-type phosphate/phosphonate transport system substrate-binding protein
MHGAPEERGTLPSEKQVPDRDPQVQAHRRVVSAVLKGEADVGVVPRRQFELLKYKKHGLVELCRFTLGGEIYASSPGLPQEVGQALQQALLSFSSVTDKAVLGRLGASVSPDGFEKIRDEDFAAIRTALEKEIAKFEQTAE